MAEILAVTWEEGNLSLYRIPSEGIWGDDCTLIKTLAAPRPSRFGRLDHPEAGGQFGSALSELFHEVDMDVPCWLLLPQGWIHRFVAELPDIQDQNMLISQLRWEIQARQMHDPSAYCFVAAYIQEEGRWLILTVMTELIARCLAATKTADLELAGIGLEPSPGEPYSFENPLDLRDGLPVELPEDERPKKIWRASAAVGGIFLVVVAIVAYLVMNAPSNPSQKESAKAAQVRIPPPSAPPATAPVVAPATGSVTTSAPTQPATTKPQVQQTQTAALAATKGSVSPLRALFKALPKGATPRVIVLSPTDLKVELTGVPQPTQWIETLKQQPLWGGAKIVGNYDAAKGRALAVRLSPSGWNNDPSGSKTSWTKEAQAAGLSVKGRTATGKLDAALDFMDHIWQNPAGAGKVYLAPQGAGWIITVQ